MFKVEILLKIKLNLNSCLYNHYFMYYYRYLASGDSMTSMSYHYLVSLTAISQIIAETCQILWEVLSPLVLVPCNETNWRAIAHDFNEKWHFPHCIGVLDGKHVVIQVRSMMMRMQAHFLYCFRILLKYFLFILSRVLNIPVQCILIIKKLTALCY